MIGNVFENVIGVGSLTKRVAKALIPLDALLRPKEKTKKRSQAVKCKWKRRDFGFEGKKWHEIG